jgi:hypothetical protein
MAATGFTPISLYYTTTAAAVPVNTNLVNGELAINITDGKLYYKDNAGVVKLLASNATVAPVTTFSAGTTGFTPSTATSGAVTLAGTLNVANGGTGLTSLTAGYIPYGNGTSAFSSLSTFNFSGTQLSIGSTSALLPGGSPSTRGEVSINGSTDSFVAFGIGGTIAGYVGQTSNGLQLDSEGATTITMVTNGAERMRITSAGDVGIGTTTPSSGSKLTVSVNTTGATVPTDSLVAIVDSKDMAIGDGGGIRMGGVFTTGSTSNPDMTYIKAYKENATSGNFSYALTFGTRANGGNPQEQMRITAAGLVGVGTTAPTALLQTAGNSSTAAFKTPNIVEVATVSATAATGTINFDITTQSVVYYTSNASANWTVNFRGSSGTSLNTIMAVGESMSATFLVTQGSTAYYNSAVQVDGSSVTPKWQGGTAPTSGNASSIDSYTYVLIKTGSAAFTVLASQTKFA